MDQPQIDADERRYKHADLTRRVIGVFYDVYNELGSGFLESVYEGAMAVCLDEAGLDVQRQVPVRVVFHERVVGEFRADLLVQDVLLLELKAAKAIDPAHEAQVLNYLRATRIEVGLILNFGPKPEARRFAYDNARKPICVDLRSSAANPLGPS